MGRFVARRLAGSRAAGGRFLRGLNWRMDFCAGWLGPRHWGFGGSCLWELTNRLWSCSLFPNKEGTTPLMLPLYAARLEDLAPGDLVQLECVCGHSELLTAATLSTAGVKPSDKLAELTPRLRCRECDARGRAVVSIKCVGAPAIRSCATAAWPRTPHSSTPCLRWPIW